MSPDTHAQRVAIMTTNFSFVIAVDRPRSDRYHQYAAFVEQTGTGESPEQPLRLQTLRRI